VTVPGLPHAYAGQLTVTATGCWRWHGAHGGASDGRRPLVLVDGAQSLLYRVLFLALRGPLKASEQLHHTCEHPWCANPWDTKPLTHDEHMKVHGPIGSRGYNANKTHCAQGHPFDEKNTFRQPYRSPVTGRLIQHRRCRECSREYERKKAREKARRRRRRP
jgi:hypothetical protein